MNSFLHHLQTAHEQGRFLAFIKNATESGELFQAIPELKDMDKVEQNARWHPEGDAWTHTLLVIENLPDGAPFSLALTALFHDVGKKYTTVKQEDGRITARGHEQVSKKIASKALDSLGADVKLKEEVLFLVYRHMLAHSKDTKEKTLRQLIQESSVEMVDLLLMHGVADVKGGSGDLTECIRLREIFGEINGTA